MEASKTKPARKKISLKWSILAVILLCWVLPIFLIVAVIGNFVNQNVMENTKETIMTSMNHALEQTASNLNASIVASRNASYNTSINDAYYAYKQDGKILNLNNTVMSFLIQQYIRDEKFKAAVVCFYDIQVDGTPEIFYNGARLRQSESNIYRKNVADTAYEIAKTSGNGINFFSASNNTYMQRNLLNENNMTPFGYLTLELNTEEILSPMRNIALSTDVTVWLENIPITVSGESMTGGEVEVTRKSTEPQYLVQDGKTYVVGTMVEKDYTLKYLVRIDDQLLKAQNRGFSLILITLTVVMIPLLAIVILFFRRGVNNPIVALNKAAEEIEKGNFGFKAEGHFGSAEFQYMADTFNQMSDTLKNQFEKLFKEELALRDAKIMALQLQINPHFLNNTLEIINWEARLAGDVKVCRMLESLSVMLSATMDRKQERIVHLSEEMMYVDAYLYIISERLGNRLSVEKNIDPELEEFYIPRLVMQPIIENAVEHGIQPLQKGLITIRVYREENGVVLEVENDGIMTNEDEEKIADLLSDTPHEGKDGYNLGIRNVNQRLKIIYGEEAGLSIKMNKNQHTVARIIIPIHQQQQEYAINNNPVH